MVTIELDDFTAQAILEAAQAQNLTVAEFLRLRVLGTNFPTSTAPDKDLEAELDGLLFRGPALPADFSRVDIYVDHD